ncbi:MAG TPA: penicillin acylase family protein [Gemmatimonadaceae bacterium]|nr:penicillin acylase family protein [Gemmatimonadaceae bacterium]
MRIAPFTRRSILVCIALLLAALATVALEELAAHPASATHAAHTPARAATQDSLGAEILWDSYGVPHIFAQDRRGIAYALGWAEMRNHGDLVLRLVAQARGRAAEYLSAEYRRDDRWVWTLDLPDVAERMLEAQPPEMRAHLDAFAEGINAFADAHPEMVGDSVRAVLPVQPVDVLAHFLRVQYGFFLMNPRLAAGITSQWRRANDATGQLPTSTPDGITVADVGSNAWAIAPGHSADGHALLLANPHLPWTDVFTWMEVQYVAPGVDVYGAALILSPVIQIGFNDDLGWTHTVNTQDGVDFYDLAVDGNGYRWNGSAHPFEERTHVMRVRQPDGSMRDDTMRTRWSVHGPVIGDKPGHALAMRAVGLDGPPTPGALAQWWAMGTAHDLREFLAAIRPNQISGQNITYADRDGHIMMFYGGNTPVRAQGDRAYWEGIVPGLDSTTLWTTLIPFERMPRVTDPPSGWVQNANDPPWWATFPVVIRPSQFPSYIASREMPLRPQRSVEMLLDDPKVSYDELLAYKHSTHMELADRVLGPLLSAVRAAHDTGVADAAHVLAEWDRAADAESRGAVLFTTWWDVYSTRLGRARSPWRTGWSASAPHTTPTGLADSAIAVEALGEAADSVRAWYGALDVPWGDVYRLVRDTVNLPSNGASGEYGVFRVQNYVPIGGHRYAAGAGGDSFVAAVEFTSPVRARALVGYGNASRAGSPHRVDQLPLYARKELRPVWRTRDEVDAHLELRERF